MLYGIFAEVSITKLLIAGILPGLLTAAVYATMIAGRCALNPEIAPARAGSTALLGAALARARPRSGRCWC